MHHIIDSTAPLDFIAKNGYYQIGDAIAVHVGPAYQEATRTNQDIRWNFNDEVYRKFNWQSRLNLPLRELYRMRAQQLRDKYDYLILWFSGGADSSTMLDSFVSNGIHLDEVLTAWPRKQTAGRYRPNTDTDPSNYVSEWDFSIEPKLKWLAEKHPEIRITVMDQLADPDPLEDYADTFTIVEKCGYAAIDRQRMFDRELRQRLKTHKNIASIMGSAPPLLAVMDNSWLGVGFCNTYASGGLAKSDYMLDGTPRNVEYFYWTPDFPELVREQVHVILDHLNASAVDRSLFLNFNVATGKIIFPWDTQTIEFRRDFIRRCVYPNWNHNTFQVVKNPDIITPWIYSWFHDHQESKNYTQGWESHINSQFALIDKKWVVNDNGLYKFKDFFSKFYPVGKLKSQ